MRGPGAFFFNANLVGRAKDHWSKIFLVKGLKAAKVFTGFSAQIER